MTAHSRRQNLGEYLFSIAVLADTHVNEEEYESNSPFECNRVANARTRWVIQAINEREPELTIHLGDLVHPVPTLRTYGEAAGHFKRLARELRSPLCLVPGNHDVGDKPVVWAPSSTVSDASLALWREHFGEHYYAVDCRDLHVVVIDAPIINSGLASEAEQRAWLERELAVSAGRRTFLCLHYPPYLADPEEGENYDNLGEPGRSWLLRLVETHRPEAMFCGHVHNFFYNRHGGTECYVLPSTTFVRQDYSEFSRVEPAEENGRNDVPKLGFCLVKIYEYGHVCHVVRSYGATIDPGEVPAPAPRRVAGIHSTENSAAPLGVDMRHPWAEVVEIPPTGALDEFERKKARNDYPLMALWEMGIRKLRLPLQDLQDPRVRERMSLLRSLGHEFTVYTLGVPHGRPLEVLIEHHRLVDVWEVIGSWAEAERVASAIGEVKKEAGLTAYLSKLRSKEDLRREGSRYYHFINHGFVVGERETIEVFLADSAAGSSIDGFVFRVVRNASPWADIGTVGEIARALHRRAAVHIRMTSMNPAEEFKDDLVNANRIGEALAGAMVLCGPGQPVVDVFVDTFADVDRGYFVRNGLVDRRYNPRLASHVVRNLYSALNGTSERLRAGAVYDLPAGRMCTLERRDELLALVLPDRKFLVDKVPCESASLGAPGMAHAVDLGTGDVMPVPWRRAVDGVELMEGLACARPVLICFGS